MTLGQKIKQARTHSGLSQEQLAQKLCVSRSAIAKWETDKGIPDVENLKALAGLLNVSVDHLLNDDGLDATVIREPYDLKKYGKGIRKTKKDRVIHEKFPNARIHTLLGKIKLTKGERIIDNVLGFFTDAPFGIPELIHSLRNLDKEFYLIEQDGSQYLVTVTDEFVQTRTLTQPVTGKKFTLDGWQYVKCAYQVKE